MFYNPSDAIAALANFAALSGALYEAEEGAFLREDGESLEVGWSDDQLWVADRAYSVNDGYTAVKCWLGGGDAIPMPTQEEGAASEGEDGLPCSLARALWVIQCALGDKSPN